MRAKKWSVGAALMDRWFTASPNSQPESATPDTSTVRMDTWVLTFGRAREVYETMCREKVWMNAPAQQSLKLVLRRKRLLGPTVSPFGSLNLPGPMVHADQINFRVVGAGMHVYIDPLDDMYAALGRFAIYCVAQGRVVPLPDKNGIVKSHNVEISAAGFYVRDSYDFNGDQPLGFWNFDTGDVRKTPWFGYDEVSNKSFRDWRDKNKKGGDFYVFSDIKTVNLTPPQSFTVNE